MCIICVKYAGAEFPAKKVVKSMWLNNPDGAGFMRADGDSVTIKKGYMRWRDFWDAYQRERYSDGAIDKTYVFHFRIATHGDIDAHNTQPFPVRASIASARALEITDALGLAHNGMLDWCGEEQLTTGAVLSDSAVLASLYAPRVLAAGVDDISLDILEACAAGSRLALLTAGGDVFTLGNGWIYENGLAYSNTSYKESRAARVPLKCDYNCTECEKSRACWGYSMTDGWTLPVV